MFVKIARLIRSLVRQGFDVVRYNPQQHLILPESLKVVGVTQNIVSGGPFDGMRLPDIDSWGQDRGSKLLSFYEQELHPTIREIKPAHFRPEIARPCLCAQPASS
jgi:hypothetical protein